MSHSPSNQVDIGETRRFVNMSELGGEEGRYSSGSEQWFRPVSLKYEWELNFNVNAPADVSIIRQHQLQLLLTRLVR